MEHKWDVVSSISSQKHCDIWYSYRILQVYELAQGAFVWWSVWGKYLTILHLLAIFVLKVNAFIIYIYQCP